MTAPATETGLPAEAVLGIDPGLASVGLASVRNRHVLWTRTLHTDPDMSTIERINQIADAIRFALIGNAAVAYEQQWRAQVGQLKQGRSTVSVLYVARVVGAIQGVCLASGVPLIEVTPAQAKAAVCCGAQADKRQVQEAIKRLCTWQQTGRVSQHAADAVAIAVAGASRWRVVNSERAGA